SFRTEVVRNLFRLVLWKQGKRTYAGEFQVVHSSIQKDHLHLIVEAAAREGTSDADRAALLSRGERARHFVRASLEPSPPAQGQGMGRSSSLAGAREPKGRTQHVALRAPEPSSARCEGPRP